MVKALIQDLSDDWDDDDPDEADDESLPDSFAYALNPDHHIRFQRRGPHLLVAFEAAPEPEAELETRELRLDALAREQDWSVLTFQSRGNTWFRAPEVVSYFDAMVDGTLLDQFEDVLFYGAGSGGHAALSYALAAPFSRVLALAPQATLDPQVAPWDTRFLEAHDIDFADRYPPTPENLSASEEVWVIFDPRQPEDARHAGMLRSSVTEDLRCRHMGHQIEETLASFGILDDIVSEAMAGTLDPQTFYTALRARRDNPGYLRGLVGRLERDERRLLEALVLRNIGIRTGRKRFLRRFETVRAELEAAGIRIPERRTPR